MFEGCDNDLDNFDEMMRGNDPRSYQLGPEKPGDSNYPGDDFDEQSLESDSEDMDPGEPDSESDSGEPDPDEPTLLRTGKSPKSGDITSRVLAMEGKTQPQTLNSSLKKNGEQKKYTQSDLSYDLGRGFLRWSTDESDGEDVEHEADDWVEVQKPRRRKRQVGTVLRGLLAQTLKTSTEAAVLADAVLGADDSAVRLLRRRAKSCQR
jgi:hypothetical protein